MHCALLGFLWVGVSWQSVTPVAVEAEIWSTEQRTAAPPPPELKPEPEPAPAKPAPEPVKTLPKPVIAPEQPKQTLPNPDIALEKIKQRKLQEKEKAEQLKKEKLAEEKAQREAEQERKKQAVAQEKKKQAEEEQQKEQQKRLLAEEEKKKLAEEQKRKLDEAAAEQRAAARRADDLRRMSSQAGTGTIGDAEKSQGSKVDASFASQAGARIKSNTIFARLEDIAGNPAVEFNVELLPDGSLRSKPRRLKSSGIEAFDLAVERAIEKSAPFKPDINGKIPSSFTLQQKPKDN